MDIITAPAKTEPTTVLPLQFILTALKLFLKIFLLQ